MDRRGFVGGGMLAALLASVGGRRGFALSGAGSVEAEAAPQPKLPRYRGFNLQWDDAAQSKGQPAFSEWDFEQMREWGFNFARIPLSYWLWAKPADWYTIDDRPFAEIDRVIELGRHYGIHVNLNLHRIPGYCINERGLEPKDLFVSTGIVVHW